MTDMPIGEMSRRSQVKVPTIRYYEQIGLLPEPPRSEGNRRLYGARDLKRLSFIRHARDLGFEIDAIRTLLTLQDNPAMPCAEADSIARDKLREVNDRIESLMALKEELEAMVGGCGHSCVGDCRVIEVLANHHKCLHAEH